MCIRIKIKTLSNRFYTVIKYLHKTNNKWLERHIINIIYKYLYNIISGIVIFVISDRDIIDVITDNSIYVS